MAKLLKGSSLMRETAWPESLPKSTEHWFFSVTCEEHSLLWCFHEVHNNMEARLVWRCPRLEKEDVSDSLSLKDRTNFFANHLPAREKIGDETYNPHDYVFGRKNPASYDSAAKQAATLETKITVYVVSSDPLQAELIFKLFSCIPTRVYLMKSIDFFITSEKRLNLSISVDRLAALRGSAHLNGFPSIVFDADNTLTYVAADSKGRLLGGGISPGIPLRLQSISGTSSSEVDLITEAKLYEKIKDVTTSKKPFPIFSNSSEDSVITVALSEVSYNARSIINLWLEKVGPPEEERRGKNPTTFCPINNTREVSVTGKNSTVLNTLLKKNHGGVIEFSNNIEALDMNAMVYDKLIPFGIQNVVGHQVIMAKERFIDSMINTRVAKEFLVQGKGVVIKRGLIVSVSLTQGINVFLVRYDDKTVEHVTATSVVAMRKLFNKVGEAVKTPNETLSPTRNSPKTTPKTTPKSSPKNGKEKTPASQSKKRSKDITEESAKKKSKKVSNANTDPLTCIGKNVAKYFGEDVFNGTITSYRKGLGGLYSIRYEDGDEEDMNMTEVANSMKLWVKLNKEVIDVM